MRPYHLARLRAAEDALGRKFQRIQGIALEDHSADIPADEPIARPSRPVEILATCQASCDPRRAVRDALDRLRPSAIAICGYATPDARECLRWARRNGCPAILMTETREADAPRVWWKEWIKSRLVRRYDGALCGGPSHRAYLEKLGLPAGRIAEGYDVVENAYFAEKTEDRRLEEARGEDKGQKSEGGGQGPEVGWQTVHPAASDGLCRASQAPSTKHEAPSTKHKARSTKHKARGGAAPFFLASSRFIERKNLALLIEAYAWYLRECQPAEVTGGHRPPLQVWDLVLLGDGELKSALIAQCRCLGLGVIESAPWEAHKSQCTSHNAPSTMHAPQAPGTVFFPGWRGYAELPRFYAGAGCFIHPATIEPWGLVINEAMASGLPILSGENAGAAEVLVDNGVNGWKFDPNDVDELVRHMGKIASDEFPLSTFGAASRRILGERCPARAFGEGIAKLLM